jgi:hypothetical protein
MLLPGSAQHFIEEALAAEAEAATDAEAQVELQVAEQRFLALRVQELAVQRSRRDRMEENEATAVAELAQSVSDVGQAIRDRRTTLRTDGRQAHTFPNQDVYDGEWKNSHMHGTGVWRSAAHRLEYAGEWFMGVRMGQGTMVCGGTATTYVGKWIDGKRHGKGEQREKEGVYKGDFASGRFNGVGDYEFALDKRHRYRGEWIDDCFDGNGTYSFPSGARYEGLWHGGRPNGKGLKNYAPGESYLGEFSNSLRHGKGTHKTPKYTYMGDWLYDVKCGEGQCVWADGEAYEGGYDRDEVHGRGVWTSTDGARYDGEWRRGLRHGKGAYDSELHRVHYEGEWELDRKHGQGAIRVDSGEMRGEWRNGVLHGAAMCTPKNGPDAKLTFDHGKCLTKEVELTVTTVLLKLGAAETDMSPSK